MSRSNNQQLPTSLNVPRKGLCVIINISAFNSSRSTDTCERRGSEKDVEVIISVFKNLKFRILYPNYDFTKDNIDEALNIINDKEQFEHFDCLVVFIMSHG